MVLQVAEGGGVALLTREEVLVDSQNLGANGRMVLVGSPLEAAQEIALHDSGADASPPAQATPVDAIQMLLIDHLLKALTGSLARLHARQALAKRAAAIQAAALAHPQIHQAAAEPPVIVADHPAAPALVSQPRASALPPR